ncbi:MAG: hypothetical protein LBS66_00590 [Rhodospirillaceae bacterium]|jgi:uncharacterized membrane-anchored protein|nr:hypothetical protein [Rhodospirillaceae bacterium]
MMCILFYILIIIFLIVGIVWLADQQGTATINWLGWHVETTASILLALLLTTGATIGSLFRLIIRIIRWSSNKKPLH